MTPSPGPPPPDETEPDETGLGVDEPAVPGSSGRTGAAATPGGLRAALAGLLGGPEGAASAEDLADVLWVARLAGLGDPAPAPAPAPPGPPPDAERADERPAVPPPRQPEPDGGRDRTPPAPSAGEETPQPAEPRVGLHPYAAAGPRQARGIAGHPVRVAQPAALAGALDLARALRPLRQSVPAPGAPVLDEEATAQSTGEAGRLVPVWRPAAERRFAVDLLVDSGATMAVWHRLAAELCTVLERHGAFADVRCWALDTDGAAPRLTAFRRRHGHGDPGRPTHWPGPLEDPSGRRVLLVLTDGVGPAWYGSALPDFLARVAGERPAAVLQVLPRRLWHRTALRTVPVELRVPDPARPVPAVRTAARLPGGASARVVRWLPVMEVDGAWLAPWAELVAGRAPGWSPMLAAPVRGVPRPRRAAAPAAPAEPAERVARFRSGASPDAFRLACHLAAAPLSLPVMRLVQQATMPSSGRTDLAELFLSGLIARRGPASPEPDEVVYDFAPGVRDELLAELTRTESLRVLDVLAKVSGRVAATFGGTLDFRALAVRADAVPAGAAPADDDGAPVLPEASLPFAEVAVAVLSGVGGQHRSLARRLAAAVEGRVPPREATAVRGLDAPGSGRPGPGVAGVPGARGPGGGAAGPPYPQWLMPVPQPQTPLSLHRLIGRKAELTALEGELDPARPRRKPAVVVVEGRLGMGAHRLVQEYARRYGDRHSFVHWVNASSSHGLEAGLTALGRALGGTASTPAETWDLLAGHRDWLLILDDLGPDQGLGPGNPYLPPRGQGVVLVTSTRVYDGRGHADAVIALEPLTRAEIADHVRASVGPELLSRDRRTPSALNRLVARLSSLPAELAKVDVRLEFARELSLADRPGPRPVYEWLLHGSPRALAGYDRDRLAIATSEGPVRLGRLDKGRTYFTQALAGSVGPVRALAALTYADGSTCVAVARGGRTVEVFDVPSGEHRFVVTAGQSTADDGSSRGLMPSVIREDGRIRTLPQPVTLLTAFTREDGRPVLVTGGTLPVQFWDGVTGDELPTAGGGFGGPVRALGVFSPREGSSWMVGAAPLGVAHVWDVTTGRGVPSPLPRVLEATTAMATVRLPYRADVLATLDGGPTVLLWDTVTGARVGSLDTGAPGGLVALTVLGGRFGASRLVTASAGGLLQVWDIGAVIDPPDPYADAGAYPPPPTGPEADGTDGTDHTDHWDDRDDAGTDAEDGQDAEDAEDAEDAQEAGAGRRAESNWPPPGESSRHAFVAWLVEELGGRAGVSRDVLSLLLGGDWTPSGPRYGRMLEQTGENRVRLSDGFAAEAYETSPHRVELRQAHLVRLFSAASTEPRSDPATWRPYEILRPLLPRMVQVLGTRRRYGGEAVDPGTVLEVTARWGWYLLLRGDYAEADELVSAAETWAAAFGPGAAEAGADGPSAGRRQELSRISLRARLALERIDGAHARARQLADGAPPGSRDRTEGRLAEAEIGLWRGRFADAERALAHAERTAEQGSMALRAHLLSSRHAMLRGELRQAARWATLARATVEDLRPEPDDGAAGVADAGGMSDLAGRALKARLDILTAELTLVCDELRPPSRPRPRSAGPDGARRSLWTTGDVRLDPALLANSVPDHCFQLFLTLSELYALTLVRQSAGPLWSPATDTRPATSSYPRLSMTLLDDVRPYREQQRTTRPTAYAGFLTVSGEALLASGQTAGALTALYQARAIIEDVYGPACPLLPRLRLLQARAHHAQGDTAPARACLIDAEEWVSRLYGFRPHQDQVTVRRAQAALTAPNSRAGRALLAGAETSAALLTDGVLPLP